MTKSDLDYTGSEGKPPRKPQPDAWYKRYPRDFYEGTRGLKLDERGAYSDILDLIYMNGGPLKDDERAIAYQLHVDPRVWRRIRGRLLAVGKLFLVNGHIHNKRARDSLKERHAERQSMGVRRPQLGASYELAKTVGNAQLGASYELAEPDLFESCNDFNGPARPRSTESDSQKEREEKKTEIGEEDRESKIINFGVSQKRLAGRNTNSADRMIKDIILWMHGGDEESARSWLATQIETYGQRIVGDSYAKLITNIATGEIVAKPLRAWCGYARCMAEDRAAPKKQGPQTFQAKRDAEEEARMENSRKINEELRRKYYPEQGA